VSDSRALNAGPLVAHQFDDIEQQHESDTLGMWAFLATEVMFFGAALTAYTVNRFLYPVAFAAGSNQLNLVLGSINTAVLLCSSLSMAMAVRAAQMGKQRQLIPFLLLTMILGAAFLAIKGTEYYHDWQEHLIPGPGFDFKGPNANKVELFFFIYFFVTLLHALHMTIGIGVVGYVAILAWLRRISPERYMPVEITGLYWHFVDIVWVFLFPLLYLIGRHQ